MRVSEASDLIGRALEAGQIDRATAVRAQAAIRARSYYGNRMTGADRARIVNVRFGIVDRHTGKVVVTCKTLSSALRSVGKRDNAYGAYRFMRRRVEVQP